MRVFTGQYERTIDAKNRIQLPSQIRAAIDTERDGKQLYVSLGEDRGTLAVYSASGFAELSARMETEYSDEADSCSFELQFYSTTIPVEMDGQGRILLPDRLRMKAGLPDEVYVVGRKHRIEIWDREALDKAMGIDWSGDSWPKWHRFLRVRPRSNPKES